MNVRTLGVAVLGLFVGLLAGVLLTEVIARPAVGGSGEVSTGLAGLLGAIMPLMGVAGAVIAVVIDQKSRNKP